LYIPLRFWFNRNNGLNAGAKKYHPYWNDIIR
jgi:hypothetical protein